MSTDDAEHTGTHVETEIAENTAATTPQDLLLLIFIHG